jgi:hypothetical protein
MADIDPPSQKEIWARKSRRQPSLAASSARPARRRAHRCWTCGRRRVKTARPRMTGPPATSQATQATRSATRTAQASQRATAILVVALRGRSGRRTSRAGRRPRSRRRGHRLGPPARAMIIVVGAALPAAGASRSAAPSLREVQGRHVRGWCCRRETRRMKTPPSSQSQLAYSGEISTQTVTGNGIVARGDGVDVPPVDRSEFGSWDDLESYLAAYWKRTYQVRRHYRPQSKTGSSV